MELKGTTLVVKMCGELDHHTADKIRQMIDKKLHATRAANILFDFGKVGFMDSSGLGMILGRYKAIKEKGGKVLACSLQPPVYRVFEVTGLMVRIPIYKSVQDALKMV